MRLTIIGAVIFLNACSSITANRDTPIDDAIKLCGLGYSSDAQAVVKAAYALSDNSGSADFGAELKENLNSQVMQFATHANISSSEDKTPLISLINKTQDCVVNYVEKTRPLTRQSIINQCREDLQLNMAGKNDTYPRIKYAVAVVDHPDYSETKVIMHAFLEERFSSDNRNIYVACEIRDNKYYGLSILPPKNEN